MKFYNRIEELAHLEKIVGLSEKAAHLMVITGRRRVGKTTLIEHFMEKTKLPTYYFFVSKKSEVVILEEFKQILAQKIPLVASVNFPDFDAFFKFTFDYLKQTPAIIIFDEFQNFRSINPAIFSIFQKYWDSRHRGLRGAFICIGSAFTLMKDIFEHSKEPLFGRATAKLYLKPFSAHTVCEILKDNKLTAKPQMLLDLLTIFGGIPKYYHLVDQYDLYRTGISEILKELVLSENASLLTEGKDMLIEELGKNYNTYFSILQVMAMGCAQMSEIATQAGMPINSIGKYLDELLNYYQIISRETPTGLGPPRTKLSRYAIGDRFLNFWFRYVFRYASQIEMANFKYVLKRVAEDFSSYKGLIFETIAREILVEYGLNGKLPFEIDNIGRYWNRTGQVEIDVVAINKKANDVLFVECKLNARAVSERVLSYLQEKSSLVEWNRKIKRKYFGIFSVMHPPKQLCKTLEAKGCYIFSLEEYFGKNL